MSSKICSGGGITTPSDVLGLAAPIDGTLRQVIDEASTGSALYISTAGVKSDGTFESTGAATLDSIVCTEGATFGGAYAGGSGATISTAGVGQFNGNLTTDGVLTADTAEIGGGYGSTGVSISTDGIVQVDGNLTTDGVMTCDSAVIGGGYGATGCTISTTGVLQCNGALTSAGSITGTSFVVGTGIYTGAAATLLSQTYYTAWTDGTAYGTPTLNLAQSSAGVLAIDDGGGNGAGDGHLLCTNATLLGKITGTPDAITATSDGVAASVATLNTEVTTNGDSDLDNVTLAAGSDGQVKNIYCVVEGNAADTWKITPASMIGGTQITFAGVGEGCTLVYDAGATGWIVIGNNGGTIT